MSGITTRHSENITPKASGERWDWLVDWGRVAVTQRDDRIEVVDIGDNRRFLQAHCSIAVEGCAYLRSENVLLYWGKEASGGYAFNIFRSNSNSSIVIYRTNTPLTDDEYYGWASFTGADGKSVRVSSGVEDLTIDTTIGSVTKRNAELKCFEVSPDGRSIAGFTPNGEIGFSSAVPGSIIHRSVQSITRPQWDPMSRYLLGLVRTKAMPWAAPVALVIVDTRTNEMIEMAAIAAHERARRYYWILPQRR